MSQSKTFAELYRDGMATFDDLDDAIDKWHNSNDDSPLYEHLGLTLQQYKDWIESKDTLRNILNKGE